MARFYYECNTDLKNYTEDSETIKPYACTSDKYCLYCCCNSQCCLLVQKRPPRHFWEAWYFWLGIALLAVFIVSLVSSYIVSNCRHNIQGVPLRHSAHGNRRNDRGGHSTNNQNEISISIIPTSEFFPSHRKMFVITSQPAVNHLSRKCVCTSKDCKAAGVDTCKTKFSCYTEWILTRNQELEENATTRGCTYRFATPLLCETKSWVTRSKSSDNVDRSSAAWIRMQRLKCCNNHDYCNADRNVNASTRIHDKDRPDPVNSTLDYNGSFNGMSPSRDVMGSIEPDPIAEGRESSDFPFHENRVKPLLVAALVLAIAALTSVLAACYVITRLLKTNLYTVRNEEFIHVS